MLRAVEGCSILRGLSDEDVVKAMAHLRTQKTGRDFQPLHLHKIVAISVVYRGREDRFKVWSLGDKDADEAEIIFRFFDGIERFTPTLVSWNGSGFDLARASLSKFVAWRACAALLGSWRARQSFPV